MIRNWLNAQREKTVRGRQVNDSSRNRSEFGQFEQLEDRRLLAFVGFFNGVTLDLVQTFDDGDVVVDNNGIGGAFRVADNSGQLSFVDATNVTVTMLDGTANQLDFKIETVHTGNVQLNLGDGPRDVFFNGFRNITGGDMEVNGGTGPQNINLAPIVVIPIPFETVGSAAFNLGSGFDVVYNNENFVIIGGDLDLTGVNLFQYTDFLFPVPLDADLKVGGNMTMDTSNESIESFLLEGGTFHDPDPTVNERSIISGNFTYIGGDDIDHVNLNDTYIQGDVTIDLGEGIPFFGDPQNVTTTFTLPRPIGPYGEIDGNIDITAGDAKLGNVITLNGYFNGDTVDFAGGGLSDTVVYSLIGTQADVTASMGAGDDSFTLTVGVNVLDIDFGNDLGDVFINNYGQFTFDSDITNFHWFDFFYTVGDDTLIMTQLIDTGDITIDNDGGISGIDWRTFTAIGGVASTTPASNLVLNMLDNTGNNVVMDLVNPVIASITMNLGDGDRNIDFVGTSNNPLRDINIFADLGVQNVELSVNAPLAVATLNADLGAGLDMVDDDANNLLLSEDLIFRGVNFFENDGVLSVARHVVLDSTGEVEETVFGSNATMFVGGNVTYIGGAGRDEVRLNGSNFTSIAGNVSLDVGDNTVGGTQLVLLDGPLTSIGGNLSVNATNAANNDLFATSAVATIGGNVAVDLGHGPNVATIVGVLGGNTVTYNGGSGTDSVGFGTTGNPVDFTGVLGDGNDVFELMAGASVASLDVDFGDDADFFINNYGPFDFNAQLSGLNGFDHAYNAGTDILTSTQVSDPGPVTVDNNGAGGAIRFIDGATTVITPVTHLTVNMQDGSGTSLDVKLDNALAGDLTVNLNNGNRALNLTGLNNSIGGSLGVTGGDGAQSVEVAVNSALAVGGSASFDLGAGDDTVDEDANDISIVDDLDFAGVNLFENNGTLTVGGRLTVDNSAETQDSVFDDDATMNVTGNFAYTGGDGRDDVSLNGAFGTTIGGSVLVDVGDNTSGGLQRVLLNSGTVSVGGSLTVASSSATNPDLFSGDAAANFGGDVDINLGGGNNDAMITGIFGGSNVTYTGLGGVDNVTYGMTGNPADVVANLGQGDDTFRLLAGSSISPTTLTIDFGDNNDTFINEYGPFDFNAVLMGLNGFDHSYDFLSNTLTSSQVSDHGAVTVDNNGLGGEIQFTNGATSVLTPVDNLTINMLNGSGTDLNVALDNAFAGDLTVNMGDGVRALNLTGTSNSIAGDLNVTGGSDKQTVEVAVNNGLTVGGHAAFDLGAGGDTVDEDGNDVSVAGNLALTGVNFFVNDGTMTVGGNVAVDSSGENATTRFDDNATMAITGDFTYTGGDGRDRVTLDGIAGGTTIGGNALIDVGDNTDAGTQFISLDENSTSVGGNLTVRSSSAANVDSFVSNAATNIGGDINVKLGDGQNNSIIRGILGGSSVKYNGGSGADNVTFGTTGNPANVNVKLGSGDDHFVLEAGASISTNSLRVDFGGGNDSFDNNYGAYTFNANLLNWNGFNRFYYVASDSLNMVQVSDTGDVTLDNNGSGNAIRLVNGIATEMTPATDVRLILMDNSSTNVGVDLDSAIAGNLIVQLRSGNRDVSFVGDNNTVGGLLRVEAADGVQNVHLAVNSDLNVGGTLIVNGRDGSDSIDASTNNINVGNAMLLRGVNTFVNNNALTVGGDFNIITVLENENTRLYNNGTMNVGGNLTYIGGGGVDDIRFNGGVNISGFSYFNLDTAAEVGNAQHLDLVGGFSTTSLVIDGGSSTGGNEINTDGGTNVTGNVFVNLATSTTANTVKLYGNYGGTYGTYRGGTHSDVVEMGAVATNMYFVNLLDDGDDMFTMQATTNVSALHLDFEGGNDTLNDNLGQPWPFPHTVLNLP